MSHFFKNIYRLFRYKNERRKYFHNKKIYAKQQQNFSKDFDVEKTTKLIVFLVPGADVITLKENISGGAISIFSIAEETRKIFEESKTTSVIICTPNFEVLLTNYKNFDNDFNVYDYSFIQKFHLLSEIIIHVPDYVIVHFTKCLTQKNLTLLNSINYIQINLLNQNIKLMPKPIEIESLKNITKNITITTAHQQYCNEHYRNYFGVPVHKFSTWVSPEQFTFRSKQEKENLLIYSPDQKPEKEKIVNKLKTIDGLKVQQIQGLTYTQFKDLISRAKWALTFGEGFDGYVIEPIFSGTIGFAVYNEEFFTSDCKGLKTFYNSYDDLFNKIVDDIKELDDDNLYEQYHKVQYNICEKQYSSVNYRNNIEKFYNKDYTFK